MNYFKVHIFLKELYKSIVHYKIRLFFSILSVSLGIGTMALIVASIEGANKKAYEIFDVFGPDAVLVIGGGNTSNPFSRGKTLTIDDAISIKKNVSNVTEVIPRVLFSPVVVESGKNNWSTTVIGTTENYFTSLGAEIRAGRAFNILEVENKDTVAVIGSKVADELYKDNIDKINDNMTLTIGLLPVKVIGILKERSGLDISQDLNDRIIMPIGAVTKRLLNDEKYVANLWFRTKGDIDSAIESARALLRFNHKIPRDQPDDFRIVTSKNILKQMKLLSNNLILFLGIAGIISLIVGGFIVANLTYISIKQRNKDIGIKSAFGATKKDIALFFLAEIIVITFIGGILGILWSVLGGYILEHVGNMIIYISYKVILSAILLSFIVGLLSGIRPAIVVSNIDPIKAIKGQ
ncbi:MAG: ABC transporter permease [Deferribacterota bacterium]|nr:ABC transporter permease [Deferribacterota bacterium]